MSKKIIIYFFVRFTILITPILILILLLFYGPKKEIHRGDPGLGVTIMGGMWLQIFFLIMLYQMVRNIFKKNNLWKANLAIMLIIIIPILRFVFLMGGFSFS